LTSDDEDNIDVPSDPSFVSRGRLFPFNDPDEEIDAELPIDPSLVPHGFLEHPVVREAYVRAFIASTFGRTTNLTTQAILEFLKSTIASFLQRDPTITGIDLKNFATTISTVERHLGVEANAYIQYFFVCSVCWKRHEPDTLYKLKSSMCTEDGCSGQLYTMKRTKKNAQKRLPCKILPYVKLFPAVQRILLRPGKYEQLQQ
jgi:hypothetical protein